MRIGSPISLHLKDSETDCLWSGSVCFSHGAVKDAQRLADEAGIIVSPTTSVAASSPMLVQIKPAPKEEEEEFKGKIREKPSEHSRIYLDCFSYVCEAL